MPKTSAVFLLLILAATFAACSNASPPTMLLPTQTFSAPTRAIAPATRPPTSVPSAAPAPRVTDTPRPTALPRSLNIEDALAQCPTAREIAAINADLKFTFESDPTAGKFVCTAAAGSADLTQLQERAYQAVLMMKRIRFDAPLPWTNKPLYDWLVGAVKGVRFRGDIENSFCCDPKDTINVQTRNLAALKTQRWIDPRSGTGLQGLTVLFVHEARHNEGKRHTCNTDDKTVAEMGAWGVQYYLLYWIAYHGDSGFLSASGSEPNYIRQVTAREASEIRRTRFCAEPTLTPGPPPPIP